MLSDELAQMVANSCPIPITGFAIVRMWWELSSFVLGVAVRLNGTDKRSDLLDRADADSIGFSQCAINGPRLCHSHFGTMHERRNVGWIGVAVANKSATSVRLEDRGLECPSGSYDVTESGHRLYSYTRTCFPVS